MITSTKFAYVPQNEPTIRYVFVYMCICVCAQARAHSIEESTYPTVVLSVKSMHKVGMCNNA